MKNRKMVPNASDRLRVTMTPRHGGKPRAFSLYFCLRIFIALSAAGQSTNLLNKLRAEYPEDVAVVLKRDKVIELYVERDSLKAHATVEESVLFLKDQANLSSQWRVHGSYFQQVRDLRAS